MKRFLIFAVLLVLLIPFGVQAQDTVRLAYLQVDLWPEYDRSEMLVILRAQLAPEVTLPVDVTFRIPAAVGDPNAVASRQPDGALLNAVYDLRVEGQWAYITVTATAIDLQLEYYDPQLEKVDAARHYEFAWNAGYAVDEMVILVQQPVRASDMTIEPNLGEFQPGSDGLNYYIMEIGAPKAGDTVSVKVDYQKNDDTLSVESFPVQASEPINNPGGLQDINFMNLLPWLLGAAGVLLVVGGMVWYWQSGRKNAPSSKPTGRGRRNPTGAGAPASSESAYCHQCGKRASGSDRFCCACGERLRS